MSGRVAPVVALSWPANPKAVEKVLATEPGEETRSEFFWMRLASGDLVLGVFPHADLYEELNEGPVLRDMTKAMKDETVSVTFAEDDNIGRVQLTDGVPPRWQQVEYR